MDNQMERETEVGETWAREEEIVRDLRSVLGEKLLEAEIPTKRRVFVKVAEGAHREAISMLVDSGVWHLSTISGVDTGDGFEVVYHIFDHNRGVEVNIKSPVPRDNPEIQTITDLIPGSSIYEREIMDLLGIRFPGHPNPRRVILPEDWPPDQYPLRKDWKPEQLTKASRRYAEIPTKPGQVILQVGPQHPALKEPINFEVVVEGEVVVDFIPHIEYNHRGVEKAFEERTYLQGIYLAERICGICGHSHTTVFVEAVEQLADVRAPPRGRFIRTIVAEMERIHSHILWLGVAMHLIGWDTMLMYSWRDREVIMDLLELVSGNRVNYAMNTLGGVRRDIRNDQIHKIRKGLDILEKRTLEYRDICLKEDTLMKRALGVGIVKPELAKKMCAVGPLIRSSGVKTDVRYDDPSVGCYEELSGHWSVVTSDLCDIVGRVLVRVDEVLESIKMLRWMLDNLPNGPIREKVPKKIPEGEAVARYEAPRGEVIHYIRSNGTDKPDRVKVRAPTWGNYSAIFESMKGLYIADIPINFGSIDPCMACASRTTFVDVSHSKPKKWTWTMEQLVEYGIRWYENRGYKR
ncbi:MAG: hypothetical protein DRO11_01200 [Methanobacteriota archaeon]|nr:MAG: hypothetical protein DRO11_01200 [Euryarchaeota archaeon]